MEASFLKSLWKGSRNMLILGAVAGLGYFGSEDAAAQMKQLGPVGGAVSLAVGAGSLALADYLKRRMTPPEK